MRCRLVLLVLVGFAAGPRRAPAAPPAPASVSLAARTWIASLTPAQRGRAVLAWNAPNRRHWGYRPFERRGLSLRAMRAPQRKLAHALWQRALTAHGYAEVLAVIERERALRKGLGANAGSDWRHPGLYYLAVFGAPGPAARWSWRLGGHHLSLNLTYQGEQLVSATPYFVGGSPAVLRGTHVTPLEEQLPRRLFATFDAAQRRAALWPSLPGDIDMQRGRAVLRPGTRGVAGRALRPEQKAILQQLLDAHMAGVTVTGVRPGALDAVRFAWRGGAKPGSSQYYRIVGPDFAIEYRNLDNHMHAVWRSPTHDFGGTP